MYHQKRDEGLEKSFYGKASKCYSTKQGLHEVKRHKLPNIVISMSQNHNKKDILDLGANVNFSPYSLY